MGMLCDPCAQELKSRYEKIPADLLTSMHTAPLVTSEYEPSYMLIYPRFIQKLEKLIHSLEQSHDKVNAVYACGAVEGYSEASSGFELYS